MAGWTSLEKLLRFEITQRTEEGCKTEGYKEMLEASPKDEASLNQLYDSLMALPIDESFPYQEPSDLDGIRRERPEQQPAPASASPSYDFFLGAWLGRSAGCALGKPVEAGPFMGGQNGIPGWKMVYEWFAGRWSVSIHTYTPGLLLSGAGIWTTRQSESQPAGRRFSTWRRMTISAIPF